MPPGLPTISFRLRYADGDANLDVATYNRTTGAWSLTAAASGRCSITQNAGDTRFSIGAQSDVLIIDDTGEVRCTKLTERQDLTTPRLDFVGRPESVWLRMASINSAGLLWAPKFVEEAPTTSLDQIRFFSLASIVLNKGFIADNFREI